MGYSMRNLAEDILRESSAPMSSKEIWAEAVKKGLVEKLGYKGNTPPELTLYNTINGDIRNNDEKSLFKKVSKNPALFFLRETDISEKQIDEKIAEIEEKENKEVVEIPQEKAAGKSAWSEAPLHAVLAMFLDDNDHFKCKVKTVRQQVSTRRKPNSSGETVKDEWQYPDLIGVYFPFSDYNDTTIRISGAMNTSMLKIFSFEMKLVIQPGNVRNYFFQAVSNSSWANEGYLVAPIVEGDASLMKELSLLSNSFGIGVIKLNLDNPKDSEILIPARAKEIIDVDMLDKLIERNPDVNDLFKAALNSSTIQKIVDDGVWDKVYSDEEYQRIITTKGPAELVSRKK